MEAIFCSSKCIFSSTLLPGNGFSQMNVPSITFPRHNKRFSLKNKATVIDTQSCTLIKPSPSLEPFKTDKVADLTPWELQLLSYNYIQIGFLFKLLTDDIISRLRSSLSAALYHFYTLNGRFITEEKDDGICISLDPNGGDGVEFIHERAHKHIKIDDLNTDEVPSILYSFFPLNGATNYDGHSLPLLSLQVTELTDGFFLACTFNHSVGDGVSFLHFHKSWAKICKKELAPDEDDQDEIASILVPRPPMLSRWFVDDQNTKIKLPYKDADEFILRCMPFDKLKLRERFFRFSSHSISQLKAKANKECDACNGKISSFQALFSRFWEATTRARGWYPEQVVTSRIAANDRHRVRPPLPNEYFGCAAVYIYAETTAGELLDESWLGAKLLNGSAMGRTDGAIRSGFRKWNEAPKLFNPSGCGLNGISVEASTRFDFYELDFGWGKPLLVRSGLANKYDGNASVYAGREGIGSIELEVILPEETMSKLELDEEFMNLVWLKQTSANPPCYAYGL